MHNLHYNLHTGTSATGTHRHHCSNAETQLVHAKRTHIDPHQKDGNNCIVHVTASDVRTHKRQGHGEANLKSSSAVLVQRSHRVKFSWCDNRVPEFFTPHEDIYLCLATSYACRRENLVEHRDTAVRHARQFEYLPRPAIATVIACQCQRLERVRTRCSTAKHARCDACVQQQLGRGLGKGRGIRERRSHDP